MEIVSRGRMQFGIIPVVHGRIGGGFGSMEILRIALGNFKPKFVCTEASDSELHADCRDELAEALRFKGAVGVDPPQISTRRKLAQRLMLHPVEAFRLARAPTPEINCLEDAVKWRTSLEAESPITFETLYRDRENAMASAVALSCDDELRSRLNDDGGDLRIAVVAGAGHISGLIKLLKTTDMHALESHANTVRDAHQVPISATPLIFLVYLLIPLCLVGPWPYAVARYLKPGNLNGQISETKG